MGKCCASGVSRRGIQCRAGAAAPARGDWPIFEAQTQRRLAIAIPIGSKLPMGCGRLRRPADAAPSRGPIAPTRGHPPACGVPLLGPHEAGALRERIPQLRDALALRSGAIPRWCGGNYAFLAVTCPSTRNRQRRRPSCSPGDGREIPPRRRRRSGRWRPSWSRRREPSRPSGAWGSR